MDKSNKYLSLLKKVGKELTVPELLALQDALSQVVSNRSDDIEAYKSIQRVLEAEKMHLLKSEFRDLRLVIDGVNDKSIIVAGSRLRTDNKMFLVAGNSVTLIKNNEQAAHLKQAGAVIMTYAELPSELKDDALKVLVKKRRIKK